MPPLIALLSPSPTGKPRMVFPILGNNSQPAFFELVALKEEEVGSAQMQAATGIVDSYII